MNHVFYYCPSCGEKTVMELDSPNIMYCRCGMTWRTFNSDIHYIVKDDKRNEIRNVMDATLVFYHRKTDEEFNRAREIRKQKCIDYLLDELMKGPIKGGTMAKPSEILCSEFNTEIWTALQRSVLIRDEICMICGQKPSVEVHHIRPRHLKGHDHPRNLIGLCADCHDEVHRKIDNGIQSVVEDSLDIKMDKSQRTLDSMMGEQDD